MSLLEAKKLSAFYSGSIALSEVDFLVNEGSVIALMGRNGMGKTTLIHCVCGIISEKSGNRSKEISEAQKIEDYQ